MTLTPKDSLQFIVYSKLSPEREAEIRLLVTYRGLGHEKDSPFYPTIHEELLAEIDHLRYWNTQHNKDLVRLLSERDILREAKH